MTDADATEEALTRAIAEDPEAVARVVERLDAVAEVLDVVELGTAALDDRMAGELTETAALLAESADGLAAPETARLAESVSANATELESALQTLVELERAGTLDDLAELADGVSLALAALDDEMVRDLTGAGSGLGELADTASNPDTVRGLETLLTAVGEASDAEAPPEAVGTVGLLRTLRDPDVRRGLGFFLAIARSAGRAGQPR
ncbi:MAG: DUF1641 domain-containing protein [Halobacteriaceae archaeon]